MANGQVDWYLVSNCGGNIALPQTMISLGREACDVILQSKSVDKRHAVITYDHYEKRFKVKDLNSINGTYLNNSRIPSHTFIKVEQLDWLRFGFDPVLYQVQALERYPATVEGVDYRRYVAGWPSPSRSTVSHQTQFTQPVLLKMSDCQECQHKKGIRHTCVIKEPLSSPVQEPIKKQDFCANIMSQLINKTEPSGHSKQSSISQTAPCVSQLSPTSINKSSVASTPQDALSPIVYRSPETSSNSLKSNFSGDSLDLICDAGGAISLIKKQSNGAPSNIVKAEKPYVVDSRHDSSSQQDMRAPSFCPPLAANQSGLKESLPINVEKTLASSSRPQSCTAFTIEFDGDRTAATKKLDIRDSISKFAPPKSESEVSKAIDVGNGAISAVQRRNLGLSKVEEIKVLECFSDENGNTDEKSSEVSPAAEEKMKREVVKSEMLDSTNGHPVANAARHRLVSGRAGYLSEGHLSSDQDDELSAKSDPARKGTAKDASKSAGEPNRPPRRVQSASIRNQYRHSLPNTDLHDSARFLINRMFGDANTSPSVDTLASKMIKSDSDVVCLREEVECSKQPPLTKNDRKTGSHSSLTSTATYVVQGDIITGRSWEPPQTDIVQELNSSTDENEDNDEVEDDDNDDDSGDQSNRDYVSESGTYTIETDGVDSKDEIDARKNIDKVFGMKSCDSQLATTSRPQMVDENIFDGVTLRHKNPEMKTKAEDSIRKTTPGWLEDWVAESAQVVSSVEAPLSDLSKSTIKGGLSEPVNSNRLLDSNLLPQRPRRKLPVPPIESISNSAAKTVVPFSPPDRTRAVSISPDGLRSDSSLDTETILKDTENVVTAMEARMSDNKRGMINAVSSIESRDSGGESDLDTSTASPVQEFKVGAPMTGVYKKLSAQLKAQLRGLDVTKNSTCNEDNVSEVETASIHSDVSTGSDLSGSSPGSKRKANGSPVMRFNRAFSLRRARLGCESDSGVVVRSAAANSKRLSVPMNSSRPNSAGSTVSNHRSGSGRRTPNSNKSDSCASSAGSVNKTPTAFGRNDGGRFSLRLLRSAPTPTRTPIPVTRTPIPVTKVTTIPKNQAPVSKTTTNQKNLKTNTSNTRCNSTLTSKELELKNWRRRKEYDPLKAAAEGRKKEAASKKVVTTSPITSVILSKSETASPTQTSFQRSISFHGGDGHDLQVRRDSFTCDDDNDEQELNNAKSSMLDKIGTNLYDNADAIYKSRNKKNSEDDSASEATRTLSHTDLTSDEVSTSPRGTPILHPVLRHKSKIDALDNLVISTIYQLTSNLRGTTANILRKIGDLHGSECEQVFGNCGLDDLIAKLGSVESPVSSPQGRTVSKQLSGILKNVKRLEDSLQSVDRVFDLVPVVFTDEKMNGDHRKRDKQSPSPSQSNKKCNGYQGKDYY